MAGISITKDNIANVYLFYGSEYYKKRAYKEKLKSLIAGEGNINYSYFEGRDINFSEVYDVCVQLPFFAPKRLVILENSRALKASKKQADDGQDKESGAGKQLELILKDLPETTCLAIFEEEISKTLKNVKTISKSGVLCECAEDSREAVLKWFVKGLAQAGKQIKRSSAELLFDRVGISYDRLRLEYEKLVAYSGERPYITDEDVLAVTSEDTESKIFDMLGAVCEGNSGQALLRYSELISNREHPLYILAMLRMQFRQMLQCADLFTQGFSDYEVADRTGKRDFVVRKIRGYVRKFPVERIESVLDDISRIDRDIKSGLVNEHVGVELLIAGLLRDR